MKIREYLDSDYEQIVPLMKAFKNEECSYDTDKSTIGITSDEKAVKYAEKALKDVAERNGYLFVVDDDSQIVGFVMGIMGDFTEEDVYETLTHEPRKVGWLGIVFVKPDYREQGICKQLINEARDKLSADGCQMIKLHVLNNNPAMKIYEKIGFRSNSTEMILDI